MDITHILMLLGGMVYGFVIAAILARGKDDG